MRLIQCITLLPQLLLRRHAKRRLSIRWIPFYRQGRRFLFMAGLLGVDGALIFFFGPRKLTNLTPPPLPPLSTRGGGPSPNNGKISVFLPVFFFVRGRGPGPPRSATGVGSRGTGPVGVKRRSFMKLRGIRHLITVRCVFRGQGGAPGPH